MRIRIALLIVLTPAIMIACAEARQAVQPAAGNQSKALVEAELGKLPAELRQQAKAVLDETDERKRAALAGALARSDPAAMSEFLLAVLSAEQAANVRLAIVDSLGRHSSASVRAELGRLASTDPDVRVSLLALERLRAQLTQDARDLLAKRLELARRSNDDAAVARLSAEQERWISLVRGTMLPSFLRVPPPRFSLKPDNQAVRVLAFGDFGTGSASQRQVAATMAEWHRKAPFDIGVTLGDNFYVAGMSSPTDARWKTQWEELYGPLGIKFYATFGNHDWVMSDSPAAEILYSDRSASWRMPSPYYTFTAGPAQFFALDTNEVSDAQLAWLDGELTRSTARWKIVYGHHPIYSDGEHGDNAVLKERLLPLLKNRADVYLAGHDHILNHVKAEGGVEHFVSGGGGAGLYKVKPGSRTLFAESRNGFTVLEATASELKIVFIGADSKPLYEYSRRK
ncbi:MAG TPA: metallophosphoesterase [Blastocatellia bacterium]|nr:metallophosphoesterase [Blastocatellia bacterium]